MVVEEKMKCHKRENYVLGTMCTVENFYFIGVGDTLPCDKPSSLKCVHIGHADSVVRTPAFLSPGGETPCHSALEHKRMESLGEAAPRPVSIHLVILHREL